MLNYINAINYSLSSYIKMFPNHFRILKCSDYVSDYLLSTYTKDKLKISLISIF